MENNLNFEVERLKKEVWDLSKNRVSNLESAVGAMDPDDVATLVGQISSISSAADNINSLSSDVSALQSNKVDKVSGKGLSSEDYTSTEKSKLSGIASGAEVNVQSNWNEADSSSDAFILNKPTIPSSLSSLSDDSSHRLVTDTQISEWTNKPSSDSCYTKVYSSISDISDSLRISSTITDVMDAMEDNSVLMANIADYYNIRPLSGTFGQGALEIKKLSANNCVARYTALANPSAASSECRMWYGEFGNSTGYEWRGWNEVSTKDYVDSAIASAITTVLNTEV